MPVQIKTVEMNRRMRQSRRSRFIALAISVAVPLSACQRQDDEVDVSPQQTRTMLLNTYQSVAECAEAKVFTPEFCQRAERDAQVNHQQLAPRYEQMGDCQKDWGDCSASSNQPVQPEPAASAASAASATHHGGGYVGHHYYGGGGGNYGSSYSPNYRGFTVAADSEGRDFRTSPIMRNAEGMYSSTNGVQGLRPNMPQSVAMPHGVVQPTAPATFKAGESAHTGSGARAAAPARPITGSSARGGMGMRGPSFGGGG